MLHKDTEYPMFDGLGSERTVTGTINQDAFGLTVNTTGSSTNPYKFAANSGYRDDGDAGLVHVGARYYDPQVGRFITRDSDFNEHPYAYCDHDPTNQVDPSGHAPEKGRGRMDPKPKPKPIPYPWPWLRTIHISIDIDAGINAGVGHAGGAITIGVDIDGKDYWGHIPAKDKDNLRKRPAKDYVRYINDMENKGK